MNDVAFEWGIPHIPGRRQKCFKALLIAETVVFLFNGLFLVPQLLIVSAALAVVCFFLFKSWKIEYEFEYVNGDLAIAKVIAKTRRKELYLVHMGEVEEVKEGRLAPGNRRLREYISNRPDALVMTLITKNDVIYLEPSREFLEELHWRRLWSGEVK